MTKLRASFNGAWEVLALGAGVAVLAVLADAGAATCRAFGAPLAVLADAGAATGPALLALLAVLAEAGAAARLAIVALPAVRALLTIALYWMWRRGGRRCCRNCAFCRLPEDHRFSMLAISLLERAPLPALGCHAPL